MRAFGLALLVLAAGGGGAAENRPADPAPFLGAVRRFADQALAHGRDVYGRPTPLFVDGRELETKGSTWVRWVYPLPGNPPNWTPAGQAAVEAVESADAKAGSK